jgi:hypothetical protein
VLVIFAVAMALAAAEILIYRLWWLPRSGRAAPVPA